MSKESFKTILLAVLVVLSIALTQQLWISIPAVAVVPSSKETTLQKNQKQLNEVNNISDIMNPQSFIISFGGKDHTVLFSDSHGIWGEVTPVLAGYFEDGTTVEDITSERWGEISDIRSIKMDFGYSMPISILRNIVGGRESGIQGRIAALDSVLVPVSEDGVVYISDKSNGKFYRLYGNIAKDKVVAIIDQIESENNYDYYSSIRQVFDVDNSVLVPLDLSKGLPKIKVEKEINVEDLKQVDTFASAFFGENFDFVKKIVETNGSVIYMYGYGQKVLKVNGGGGLEYIEEIDSGRATANVDMAESIRTAVHFVLSREITPGHNIYLRDIRPIDGNEGNKRKGYQLLFANRINGLPVYVQENTLQAPIEVQVFGKQVTYYKKLLPREKINVSFIPANLPTLLALHDVIIGSLPVMKSNAGILGDDGKIFSEIMANVKSVELCYYKIGDRSELVPVWRLQVDDDIYFFDAYKGNIIRRFKAKL